MNISKIKNSSLFQTTLGLVSLLNPIFIFSSLLSALEGSMSQEAGYTFAYLIILNFLVALSQSQNKIFFIAMMIATVECILITVKIFIF